MTEANKPKSSGKITITMEPMVQWFSPLELIQTGIRTLVAGVFGTYADRRDIQAALHLGRANPDQVDADYSQREELWIDYLADTGDGWNSTYSMAYLLAQPQLNLANTKPHLAEPQSYWYSTRPLMDQARRILATAESSQVWI